MARSALLYHMDIRFGADLKLISREFDWKEMTNRFKEALAEPKRVFGVKQSPKTGPTKDVERPSQQLRRGKGR
jgi:hypothetical protein